MKKLIMMTAVAMTAAMTFGELKFGTVDMMTLVRNHPNYESNKKLVTDTERDYQAKLDKLKAELDGIAEEGKKLADEYRNPMLAQTAKAKIETDLANVQNRGMALQQKLRNEAMRNQQELTELEGRLLRAQAEDIRSRISKFAEANGYDFIIDVAAAMYSKKSVDVTKEILNDMGVKNPVKSSSSKDEVKK